MKSGNDGKEEAARTSRDQILGDFWTWSLIGSGKWGKRHPKYILAH